LTLNEKAKKTIGKYDSINFQFKNQEKDQKFKIENRNFPTKAITNIYPQEKLYHIERNVDEECNKLEVFDP